MFIAIWEGIEEEWEKGGARQTAQKQSEGDINTPIVKIATKPTN